MTVSHPLLNTSHRPRRIRAPAAGFTLIELMIAVAVIGILAAASYPSYAEHVRQSRVSDALTLLAQYQLSMEQASQDNGNYGVEACAVTVPASTPYFRLSCALAADGQTFAASATGINGMAGFTYTINDAGTKRTTAYVGASGLPAACWLTRKGGC